MAKYTFLDLANDVLKSETTPMTVEQIWSAAEKRGITGKMQIDGKTPKATLGARLYVDVNKPESLFVKIGAWPARFLLKSNADQIPKSQLEAYGSTEVLEPAASVKYLEKDLHPLLVWFGASEFSGFDAECKTILHSKSEKKGNKSNEWLHPDIVGFSLETDDWAAETVGLFRETVSFPVRLYSFELKLELSYGTLRESFFQAVSNSSWAHQGYLVASTIKDESEFREELERLSQAFGIGVIELNTQSPVQSKVLYPARINTTLDWKTIDRLVSANSDFREFINSVSSSVKINQAVTHGFDKVLSLEELEGKFKHSDL